MTNEADLKTISIPIKTYNKFKRVMKYINNDTVDESVTKLMESRISQLIKMANTRHLNRNRVKYGRPKIVPDSIIKELVKKELSATQIAKEVGLHRTTISRRIYEIYGRF